MKRLTVTLFSVFMIMGLSACKSQTAGNPADDSNTAVSSEDFAADEQTAADEQAAPGQNAAVHSTDSYNTIIVSSSEKVAIVPDIAEVVYSVRTKDSSAAGCQQKNAEAVSQVTEQLKGLNVEEASIKTSDYSMNPVYDYSGNTPRLTGYEAISTLTVSDLPIDDLDEILEKSVTSGINTIQSITYQASQYDKSYQEALTKAVASAREKAQVLAQAAGAEIGNVVSIQETSGYSEARYTDYARSGQINSLMEAKQEAAADTAGSIMPGEIQVEAGITAEYQLIAR